MPAVYGFTSTSLTVFAISRGFSRFADEIINAVRYIAQLRLGMVFLTFAFSYCSHNTYFVMSRSNVWFSLISIKSQCQSRSWKVKQSWIVKEVSFHNARYRLSCLSPAGVIYSHRTVLLELSGG